MTPQDEERLHRARQLQEVLDQLLKLSDLVTQLVLDELWQIHHPGEPRPRRPWL